MTWSALADHAVNLALAVICLISLGWLLTHLGCAYPLQNILALVAYVASGATLLLPRILDWADRNLHFTEEAGDE